MSMLSERHGPNVIEVNRAAMPPITSNGGAVACPSARL
jgi:hypothetical protein